MKQFIERRAKLLFFALLVLQTLDPTTAQYEDEDDNFFRLPTSLAPEEYSLSLRTNPKDEYFSGTVEISFNLTDENSPAEHVYLHADSEYITIIYAQLNGEVNCTYQGLNNYIVKLFCGNITDLNNVLYMEFNGKYSESDEHGLVKAIYKETKFNKPVLIEARFEPTFARRVFPCFDEPEITATFSLEVIHPKDFTAVSSTFIRSTEDQDDGFMITSFEPTRKIPAYLLSIFVSKFKQMDTIEGDEYSLKILTRPEFDESTIGVASTHYSQIIEVLTEFTGQSFEETGNAECYQVAIPDYYSENMGDFGLFVYRERDLLDEGDKTSARTVQNILQNMACKLSHQWFGGEVTSKWWSDIWANEAIPTYFKYIIPDKVHEDFECMNQFVVEVIQKSMQYDAMAFVRPLSSNESDVVNEWEIEHKSDKYSLLKGASVIHMISIMVDGEDRFKANLQDHLRKRSDTDGLNLLEDLTSHDGIQNLLSAAHPWAFVAGFPLLNVFISEYNAEKEVLAITQKRFVYPTTEASTVETNLKWTIPISYTTSSIKNFDTRINVYYTPNVDVIIDIRKDNWVIFNLQGRLHYRVNYEEVLWRRIISALKNDTERVEIHPLNRAQLIDDIFSIARMGDVGYSLAFELADYLIAETDYYPWYSAFNAFSYLLDKMGDDIADSNLKMYILNLMDNIILIPDSNHAENKTYIDVFKNVMVLEWACKLGHLGCIEYAKEQFSNFKENQSSIEDSNFRHLILCNGIRYSENLTVDWRFLRSLYESISSSSAVHEQYDILKALACSKDFDTLHFYVLELAAPTLSSDIKRQDALVVFESVLTSSEGTRACLRLFTSSTSYLKFIYNYAADEVYVIADMILALAEKITTDDQLDSFKEILNQDSFSNFQDLKARALALAQVNNYWAKKYQEVIKEIIYERLPTTEGPTTTEVTSSTQSTKLTTVTEETTVETTTNEFSTTPGHGNILLNSNYMIATCVAFFVINNFITLV